MIPVISWPVFQHEGGLELRDALRDCVTISVQLHGITVIRSQHEGSSQSEPLGQIRDAVGATRRVEWRRLSTSAQRSLLTLATRDCRQGLDTKHAIARHEIGSGNVFCVSLRQLFTCAARPSSS